MINLLLPRIEIQERAAAINGGIPARECVGAIPEKFFRINDFEFFEERRSR
jgi:hypothetical protein